MTARAVAARASSRASSRGTRSALSRARDHKRRETKTRCALLRDHRLHLGDTAISLHALHVSQGREIALELVNAHGSPRNCPSCGFVADYNFTVYRERNGYMQLLYGSTYRNVCAWVNLDASCYSGNMVAVFNAANNSGRAQGCDTITHRHCYHASYDRDMAMASSTTDEQATNGGAGSDISLLRDAIEEARSHSNNRVDRYLNAGSYNASYVDEGYGTTCP